MGTRGPGRKPAGRALDPPRLDIPPPVNNIADRPAQANLRKRSHDMMAAESLTNELAEYLDASIAHEDRRSGASLGEDSTDDTGAETPSKRARHNSRISGEKPPPPSTPVTPETPALRNATPGSGETRIISVMLGGVPMVQRHISEPGSSTSRPKVIVPPRATSAGEAALLAAVRVTSTVAGRFQPYDPTLAHTPSRRSRPQSPPTPYGITIPRSGGASRHATPHQASRALTPDILPSQSPHYTASSPLDTPGRIMSRSWSAVAPLAALATTSTAFAGAEGDLMGAAAAPEMWDEFDRAAVARSSTPGHASTPRSVARTPPPAVQASLRRNRMLFGFEENQDVSDTTPQLTFDSDDEDNNNDEEEEDVEELRTAADWEVDLIETEQFSELLSHDVQMEQQANAQVMLDNEQLEATIAMVKQRIKKLELARAAADLLAQQATAASPPRVELDGADALEAQRAAAVASPHPAANAVSSVHSVMADNIATGEQFAVFAALDWLQTPMATLLAAGRAQDDEITRESRTLAPEILIEAINYARVRDDLWILFSTVLDVPRATAYGMPRFIAHVVRVWGEITGQ